MTVQRLIICGLYRDTQPICIEVPHKKSHLGTSHCHPHSPCHHIWYPCALPACIVIMIQSWWHRYHLKGSVWILDGIGRIFGWYVQGYVLGQTWQPIAAMFDLKHTPVGTCKINCKFNNDRRVSPQVLLQCMFSLKHTLKIHFELGVS